MVHLVQSGAGDDDLLTMAWNKIGDYYTDHQKWSKALQWYSQARNSERMIECVQHFRPGPRGTEEMVQPCPLST